MRPQLLIAVHDVEASSRWYQQLLGCESAYGVLMTSMRPWLARPRLRRRSCCRATATRPAARVARTIGSAGCVIPMATRSSSRAQTPPQDEERHQCLIRSIYHTRKNQR